jgi:hypothetical protein
VREHEYAHEPDDPCCDGDHGDGDRRAGQPVVTTPE